MDRSLHFNMVMRHTWPNLILCVIILTCFVGVAHASIADDVSNSITGGIEGVFLGLIDDLIESSVSSGDDVRDNQSIALDAIFNMATYTPNPYALTPVQELRQIATNLFYDIWWYIISIAMIIFLFTWISGTDNVAKLNSVVGYDVGAGLKSVLRVLIIGVFVLVCESLFVWVVLTICDSLTKRVMMGSLNAVAFTPDNLALYIIIGIGYMLLSLCFYYRTMVIMFFAATSILWGIALAFNWTADWAWKAHLYFIQIVAFQFFIVLWYTFCIICVDNLPGNNNFIYILMVLVSFYASWKFIFHLDFIKAGGRIGRVIVLKR